MANIPVAKIWDSLRRQFSRTALLKISGQVIRYGLLVALTGLIVYACSSAPTTSSTEEVTSPPAALVILWDKGYVTEEDEAIKKVVADWQAQGGFPVMLSFYNSGETAPKTLRASRVGVPPDILFAAKSVYPVSEWEGKLADVTEVVAPHADSYTQDALQTAKVYGSEKAKDRYYAVPINQATTHIYYWKDLLAEAGYAPDDIPTAWDQFWSFWQTVQSRLSAAYPTIHSIGLPYSEQATDTYQIFDQILVAYNVKLLDEQNKLQIDKPEVRAGIIQCLDWYLQFYKAGYVPTNAVDWLDPDNNRNLLDRKLVMTPNPTLSIPAAVRNDEDIYFNRLGTVEFPDKPNGEPLPHLVSVRLAVIFADSPHLSAAKAFLAYLTQPTVLSDFLKAGYGRFMPPGISQIEADSFWQDPADPHVSTAIKTVTEGRTQPFYNVENPAYGVVMEENVWGQTIHAMAADGLTAEAAADRAIAQIQTIFRKSS